MDTKKSKQLSKLEKELIKKFDEAKREEVRRLEQVERDSKEETKPKLVLGTPNITLATPRPLALVVLDAAVAVKDAKKIEGS